MVTPKDVLKNFLPFRHNLPYLHCGETAQFPLGIIDQSPLLILLFLSKPVDLRVSEARSGQGGSLSFVFKGMCILAEAFSLLEPKLPGHQSTKLWVLEAKNFLVGH